MISTTLGRLRVVGILEGLSFLILVGIAMPLKYFLGQPLAVQVAGMAHGVLFILFIAFSTYATWYYKWPIRKMFLLWIASVLPFGTFVADHLLLKPQVQQSGNGQL